MAPGQVVAFLAGGLGHGFANFRPAGGEGLAVVQALGCDLAGVIDADQPRDVTSGVVVHQVAIEAGRRIGALGMRTPQRRPQRQIRLFQEPVKRRQGSIRRWLEHGTHYIGGCLPRPGPPGTSPNRR